VEEPFPFAFVEGEDPIRSANMLYAQRFLKRNDLGESPIKVFLDGEVRDIAVDEVLALGAIVTLGIGGWIGVGKSTICSFFKEELCADVLSLDSISHELYEVPEVSSVVKLP